MSYTISSPDKKSLKYHLFIVISSSQWSSFKYSAIARRRVFLSFPSVNCSQKIWTGENLSELNMNLLNY
jgi:hypothetical protein